WLNRTGGLNAPTGPVQLLRLTPVETVPTSANQGALWGGDGMVDERAHRALARVQTLLGPGSVQTPMVSGGRGPAQRTRWVPWGDQREDPDGQAEAPWPGRLPAPAPSVLLSPPRPVQLLDHSGQPIRVTERGAVTGDPAVFALGYSTEARSTDGTAPVDGAASVDGTAPAGITAWAGPWPVDERWWDPQSARQLARMQLVDVAGRGYLVCFDRTDQHWLLEGIYD